MNAAVKGKYEYDSDKMATSAISTIAIPAGDLKLKASMSDATFTKSPSFSGLSLSLEKPGSFIFHYDVPNQDFRFQFMNSIRVLEKQLNLTYIHNRADNRTVLDGTLVLDSCNKVSANHMMGSDNGKFKYTYVHQGHTTFEPSYDLSKNSWDFALSRRVYGDLLKASYQTSNHKLGLEWSKNSKRIGCLKISALFNLAEEVKMPKLMAETTWNIDL
ncbi:outer envelope pore protein 24B, chloroplastic-like [Silene latifolia]|uniref:outer envelope pore protein 24B, chloroplastic-like n=1 Tax=Silene latifolia TaxID=37657 RepID=UPI003D7726BF